MCFPQSDAGWEEYYDYIFPEDAANQPNRKLLAMVKLWKKQQMVENAPEDQESAGEQEAPTQTDTAVEQKDEVMYDDRDDGSSSSSESNSIEDESKQSQDADKD